MPAISASPIVAANPQAFGSEETRKFLSLQIETVALIVPIELVFRILSNVEVHNTGDRGYGITHLGEREISVLNLHHHLFQREFPQPTEERADRMIARYAVAIQSQSGDLYGIPVDRAPALLDVPLSDIRRLPDSYRQVDTLGIASHVAVVREADRPNTYFVIDIEGFMALARA